MKNMRQVLRTTQRNTHLHRPCCCSHSCFSCLCCHSVSPVSVVIVMLVVPVVIPSVVTPSLCTETYRLYYTWKHRCCITRENIQTVLHMETYRLYYTWKHTDCVQFTGAQDKKHSPMRLSSRLNLLLPGGNFACPSFTYCARRSRATVPLNSVNIISSNTCMI